MKYTSNESGVVMSQTFHDLRVPSNLVGNRSSARSIMIGTLFILLQEALACGRLFAHQTLARIIKQDPEVIGAFSIATTRVPDFGDQISTPSHGFRTLCSLGGVTPQLQEIPQTFHLCYELLASKTGTDNPAAVCFAESFQPMGLDLNSHFNIIFFPFDVSSIPSLWGSSTTSAESSLSPWDSISAAQSQITSPQVQVDHDITALFHLTIPQVSSPYDSESANVLIPSHLPVSEAPSSQPTPSPQPQPPHFSESSPYGSANVLIPSSHFPAAPPQPQPQPQPEPLVLSPSAPSPLSQLSPRLQTLPSLPPQLESRSPPPNNFHCSISNGTQDNAVGQSESSTLRFQPSESGSRLTSLSSPESTIPLLLRNYGISDEEKDVAIYKRSVKGLFVKVRNFNAMNSILDCMGYSLPFRVSADPTIKLSNITVKASEVLHYFGWAPTSFEHKAGWYGTAKTLSQLKWKTDVPSEY
jgi:hypothetical protein